MELREEIAEESKTIEAYDDLAVSFYKMGSVETDLQKKKYYFEQMLAISQDLLRDTGDNRYKSFIEVAVDELEKLNN